MEEQLQAVADPTRREILHLAAEGEVTVGELARQFDITRPAVSQHLRVLREAGLVNVRPEGTRRLYSTDRDALAELLAWLDDFWSTGLLRLKSAAERRTQQLGQPERPAPRRRR